MRATNDPATDSRSAWTALSLGTAWDWGIATSLTIGLGADPRVSVTQITLQIVATWCLASIGAALVGLVPVGTLLDALKDRS